MRTGIANLPLHGGKAPAWLFEKMKDLAGVIAVIIVQEYGTEEFLKKLADPFWFQAFGSVLGFDWHSSGLTTTTCGALKEGLKGKEKELGIYVCGGKGRTSRKTPDDIRNTVDNFGIEAEPLVYASKMSAKVDNTALQDGYQLYHHSFIYDKSGKWAVVQQGMNEENRYARRYHWLNLNNKLNFVNEPHSGIVAEQREKSVLNLVASEAEEARNVTAEVAKMTPEKTVEHLKKIQELSMPSDHFIRSLKSESLNKVLLKTYERQAEDFEKVLAIEGVGPKTIRALTLISELIYGAKASHQDPAKFSFAHGGKDGIPYPVDKENYDHSIQFLKDVIARSEIDYSEKRRAFKRLGL
jgi:hypothetical protein